MEQLTALLASAASIALIHTVLGPDHYLPFIVIGKARNWSLTKTAWVTGLSGVGHVLSSVVLGFIGIAAGIALKKLEITESVRGGLAAWMLTAFGLVYGIWGLQRAVRNKPHQHKHTHPDGTVHLHTHVHKTDHHHLHAENNKNLTPWILFVIFVFGPCEPLIPLLMYPAVVSSIGNVFLVAGVFGTITIGTMMSIVLLASKGLNLVSLKPLEKYSHAIAGLTIVLCGVAIFLGL